MDIRGPLYLALMRSNLDNCGTVALVAVVVVVGGFSIIVDMEREVSYLCGSSRIIFRLDH